jgi:hypothetical protein
VTTIPLVGQQQPFVDGGSHARVQAARVLYGIGLIFLVGTIIDLAVLWIGQRQPSPQWEFVAIANTAEAFPRIGIAVAMTYLGLWIGGAPQAWVYRSLGAILMVLALVNLGLGAMLAMDYIALAGGVTGEAAALLKSTTFKTVALCGLYGVVCFTLGILGIRTAESRKKR